VIADATRLPDHVEASIEGLEAGARVTAGNVRLPEGTELAAEPDLVLVVIAAAPTAEQMAAEGGLPQTEEEAAEAAQSESAPVEAA
jgi:large subunit ribosomal protein L25